MASRNRAREPGASLRLRPVRPADAEALTEQRLAMFREIGDVPPRNLRGYAPRFRTWFRHELRADRLFGYVIEATGDRVVGGGLVWLQPRLPSPRFPHRTIPYAFSVYTDPEFRSRGIATRIMEAVIEDVRRRGFPGIELHATEAGRGVYLRLGFQPTTQLRLSLEPAPSRKRDPERRGAAD